MTIGLTPEGPNVVNHRTVATHRCALCWHWVVDCDQMVQPLRLPHRLTPKDMLVQSFAYDRAGRRLEIFYRWKTAAQYSPISPAMFEEFHVQKFVHDF